MTVIYEYKDEDQAVIDMYDKAINERIEGIIKRLAAKGISEFLVKKQLDEDHDLRGLRGRYSDFLSRITPIRITIKQ